MLIRPATKADMPAIAAIYADAVVNGTASFELVAPRADEMLVRYHAIVDAGFPYIVAERDSVVLGYAYASPFRTRPAYRATCEDSIYIAPDAQRQGVGRTLLRALIAECTERGYRQMIAGVSGGDASIKLHEAHGFVVVGRLPAVGFKLGRWVDVVFLQLALGPGDSTPLG
jgi:phosphinothricin acetyltransferase